MDHTAPTWDPTDPFVLDGDGYVVGLRCAPPHHAELLAVGWEGGHNLSPLVADAPERFTADVLVYTRGGGGARERLTAVLPDEPPYVYLLSVRSDP